MITGDILQKHIINTFLALATEIFHLYEYQGVFGGAGYEEGPEVGAAGGQHQFVCLEGEALRHQTDIGEALLLPELLEYVEQLAVVVAPLQHVLGNLFVKKLFG